MDNPLLIVCLPLAVWRVSYMIAHEIGPFSVFETLRFVTKETTAGDLLSCVYCLSIWFSALLLSIVVYTEVGAWIVYWLALSAAATLIQMVIERGAE